MNNVISLKWRKNHKEFKYNFYHKGSLNNNSNNFTITNKGNDHVERMKNLNVLRKKVTKNLPT